MQTIKIGIRELVRNSKLLNQYDYVEIVDKKTDKFKGIFISGKVAEEFKHYLELKKKERIEEKIKAFENIVPLPPGSLSGETIQTVKSKMDKT